MKKILLVCNDGMSTGFLTNKMNEYIQSQGLDYEVRAISEMTLDREWENSDCILLGPQIGYLKDSIVSRIHNARPVEVISPIDYGRINAKGVVNQALKMLGDL